MTPIHPSPPRPARRLGWVGRLLIGVVILWLLFVSWVVYGWLSGGSELAPDLFEDTKATQANQLLDDFHELRSGTLDPATLPPEARPSDRRIAIYKRIAEEEGPAVKLEYELKLNDHSPNRFVYHVYLGFTEESRQRIAERGYQNVNTYFILRIVKEAGAWKIASYKEEW